MEEYTALARKLQDNATPLRKVLSYGTNLIVHLDCGPILFTTMTLTLRIGVSIAMLVI